MRGADDVIKFHPWVDVKYETLADFHEWAVKLALGRFAAKTSNDEPVNYFILQRGDRLAVIQGLWQNELEKRKAFDTVRHVSQLDTSITMLAFVTEVWIHAIDGSPEESQREFERLREEYGAVRNMPGREDGLLVSSESRNGGLLVTRWVVKLKPDPKDNIVLARDDQDTSLGSWEGQGIGFFRPVKEIGT